jgi:hypothetical protein
MSTSDRTAFEEAPDAPETDSVFDFLYHDVRRVGSFLAQLDEAGHLQQVTQTDLVTKSRNLSWKAGLSAGIPKFGQGEASVEKTPGTSASEGSERVYDPLWANARTLLDYLSERGLIERDIHAARIGQFVLASGALQIVDLTLMRTACEKPNVRSLIAQGSNTTEAAPVLSRQQRRHQERKGPSPSTQKAAPSASEVGAELIPLLPHAIQATLRGATFRVWSSFVEANVVGVASDLVLKHGLSVPGEWHMLGVLDALPDDEVTTLDQPEAFERTGTAIGALAAMFGSIARQIAARPAGTFGVTPLLVLRNVSMSTGEQ